MKIQSLYQLTGTFFCVTTTAQSFPLTATDVSPPWFMALKAYSANRIENRRQVFTLNDILAQYSDILDLKNYIFTSERFIY